MSINIEELIPRFTRSALHVGQVPDFIGIQYRQRVERLWTLNGACETLDRQIIEHGVDSIVLHQLHWLPDQLPELLHVLHAGLNPDGQISLVLLDHDHAPYASDQLDHLLAGMDLMRYQEGPLNGAPGVQAWCLTLVRKTYNPVQHARHLASLGRPDCAIAVLNAIPMDLVPDNRTLARLALEKQRHYFTWQCNRDGQDPPHGFFSKARREFAQVTALTPWLHESYHLHARYWDHLGRGDMAARLLRSIEAVAPLEATRQLVQRYEGHSTEPARWISRTDSAAEYPTPRILVITHDHSDYGMDTLFHGLCTLLGKENVVEYPWKPTLHGRNSNAADNYPCVFDYPGEPRHVSDLVRELKHGRFDLILYADVVQMAYQAEVRQLIHAAPHVPLVLYDTWDDCFTPVRTLLQYCGRPNFDLIFKREMLAGVDYGPHTHPLPFGYPDSLVEPASGREKSEAVFWAGKKEYGLRPLYIPRLEARLGRSLDRRFDQAQYQRKLRNSDIGLSFFGCGFDTVRYWELPANQVMLMAERPPICIPYDFVDGQSAVFFDDLSDLERKLDYYLHHPGEVDRIAAAGHAHFLRYHTSSARARQFLATVAQVLNWDPANGWSGTGSDAAGGRPVQDADTIAAQTAPRSGTAPKVSGPLYLGLVKGENYGWGVCSRYLIDELSKIRTVQVLSESDGTAGNPRLNGKLFQALTNVEFRPMFEQARGKQNYAYTFFENELTAASVENARGYDLILGGSSWCRDRMVEKGISNCDVLIQGIDPAIFHPLEDRKEDGRFVIFSGGKFELRKGQDLVLRAVKIMQDKYPDVWLINCWFNLWPASTRLMCYSRHILFEPHDNESWSHTMMRTCHLNGLDTRRIQTFELVPQDRQRELFRQSDIGVFPNRCEGGTNLVLMEYMACAKPAIVSMTSGHKDIVSQDNALLLRQLAPYQVKDAHGNLIARWEEPSLDELVAQLEYAYHHKAALRSVGRRAGEDLKSFTWAHSAAALNRIIEDQ